MKRKILALALASIMALVLFVGCKGDSGGATSTSTPASAGGSSQDASGSSAAVDTSNAEFEFNVNYTHPEATGKALTDYCNRIEEQSGGRIKFNHYYANSLMSIPEIPKGLQDGIADISYIPLNNYQQQFPLNAQILAVPFLGLPDIQSASDIYVKLMEEFPELNEEFTSQGMTPIGPYPFAPYQLMFNKEIDVTTPADLNGLKIIASSSELQQLISDNGGAPITQPPTEFYSSLEKGVADGVINHYPAGVAFGILPELTKHIVEFGEKGLIYNYTVTCVRTESLEKLPEDLQALFFDSNASQYIQEEVDLMYGFVDNAVNLAKEGGDNIVTLTDEQINVWKDSAEPYREATISALEKDQPVARDIYNRAIELIAEYDS